MNPVHFLKYFKGQKQFARLTKKLAAPPGEKIHLKGLIGSSKTILAANLSEILQNSMLFLLADREEAAYLYDDLNNLGLGQSVIFFPSSYKRSIQYDQPDQEFIVQRTEALNTIQNSENPYLIITFPEAIVEKVISPENFKKNTLQINAGDKISIRFINEFLFEYGFERV
ncbi:MAG: transcription-repair coupling factor, partial [Bacteroidales bacterium]|nr:transcription-repair coupling factor [Bacteroidales bacterium]